MNNFNWSERSIRSEKELREIVGTPHEAVVKKTISIIDDQSKNYLSLSPILFLSTSDEKGKCDVSPRGDQPGFARVADQKRLIIPEKPGNRRADSMMNILSNPQVGLVFLIPGMEDLLRINGRACIMRTADLPDEWKQEGDSSLLSIVVEVEECFIHCPRALKKSGIWKTDSWPQKEQLPSANQMFRAHLKLNGMILED